MIKFVISGILSVFISIMSIVLAWTIIKELEASVIITVLSVFLIVTGLWLIIFARLLGGN